MASSGVWRESGEGGESINGVAYGGVNNQAYQRRGMTPVMASGVNMKMAATWRKKSA